MIYPGSSCTGPGNDLIAGHEAAGMSTAPSVMFTRSG
jgi:hypothetical protein